jgi:peptidoglycan L-alanyl-D-glutamate endopeptidase CwlK
MPRFSQHSRNQLDTCCDELRLLFATSIRYIDFKVIEGYRSNERQADLFNTGLSKAAPGMSKHNVIPSDAVDIAPYPINWKDTDRFVYFAGRIIQIAEDMGLVIRWGGDWNMDTFLKERFKDLGHFEIRR